MFLVFEMPVGRLLQSALAEGRSRLNLFPMTVWRTCLGQRELSIGCESWRQLAYRWSGGGKLLSKLLCQALEALGDRPAECGSVSASVGSNTCSDTAQMTAFVVRSLVALPGQCLNILP